MRSSPVSWRKRWSVLLVLLAACGGSGGDAEKIADALTDRLSFIGGQVVESAPPDEHAEDSAYPQVTAIDAPAGIVANQAFQVVLTTDYAAMEEVQGAVLYVENASKHIKVTADLDGSTKTMTLTGTYTANEDVPGDLYHIKVALRNATGVGNYQDWALTTPRTNADCESACKTISDKGCMSETYGGTLEKCVEGCLRIEPSLDCFDCINLDTCTEMTNCVNKNCPVDTYQATDGVQLSP